MQNHRRDAPWPVIFFAQLPTKAGSCESMIAEKNDAIDSFGK
jgi:hypothetical protein